MPSVSPGSSAQKARENADKPRRAGAGAIGARLAAAALILRALVLLAASAAAVITLGAIAGRYSSAAWTRRRPFP